MAETFSFLDYMSDNWLVALRLKEEESNESLKELQEMEDEDLILVNDLKK